MLQPGIELHETGQPVQHRSQAIWNVCDHKPVVIPGFEIVILTGGDDRRSALSHFPGPTIYRQRKFSHQGQHQLMMIMGVCLPMIAVTLQLDF